MEATTFLESIHFVVRGDVGEVDRRLSATPALATMALPLRPTRSAVTDPFLVEICHHMYGGDTALHMAAAAFSRPIAELLLSRGADCRARNRRGAEPLHYAADANRSEPEAQASVIEYLISIGADPNARDKPGVAPLHRALRTRSIAAVRALLDGGAKPQPNNSGSTPLHLAVQNTGRSGSGSEAARTQAGIVGLLLQRGASPTDKDLQGKQVVEAATTPWVRALLIDAG